MDRALNKRRLDKRWLAGPAAIVLALGAGGLGSGPVRALGPAAPFTPPRTAAAASAATAASTEAAPATGATASNRATAADGRPPAPEAALSGVAGVRLGAGTALALVDGQWRPPGSALRGGRLAAVTRRGVWLAYGDGKREFLPLLPAPPTIDLSPVAPPAAAAQLAHPRAQP